MPTLVELATCKIQVYAGDHAPPYFKIYGPGTNANVAIETLELIAGKAHRKALRKRATGPRRRKTGRSSGRPGRGSMNEAELPLIRSVEVLNLYRVRIEWQDGRTSEVDLAPHVLRYALYRPLRENFGAFERVELIDDGVSIAWPAFDLDISADAIAALERTQTMSGTEFRERLKRLGLSFDAAAATFDISRRQIAYYSAGAKPVPRHVVLALRGFEAEVAG